jgi:Mrp family chromosome partitioning ATPase
MGKPAPTVVVASDDPVLLDEIVRHLEELPSWRLAGSARTTGDLQRLFADHSPDAALVSAGLARELERELQGDLYPGASGARLGRKGSRLVVVATEQEPGILRCSLRLGAGFVLWPQERADLRATVEAEVPAAVSDRARLVAVWGPKGGSGASVLAAHLAAAAAACGRCMLVDLDLCHGDQRVLLGAGDHPRTLLDLLAVGDDIPPEAVEGVAWRHPAGFAVVLSPGPAAGRLPHGALGARGPQGAEQVANVPPEEPWTVAGPDGGHGLHAADSQRGVAVVLDAVRETAGLVLADLPSGLGPLSLEIAGGADAVALVVTPDLLALRRTRDAARAVAEGPEVGAVLNRWSRGNGGDVLSPGDVEAVLRVPVWAKVPLQAGLLRAPDLGRLSRPACRALAPLAALIAEGRLAEAGRAEVPKRSSASAAPATAGGRR